MKLNELSKRTTHFALLCAVVAAACGGEMQPADSGSAVSDQEQSVVVPTSTTARSELESAPAITLREELRIGPSSGPVADQFSTISHTTFGSDGNVYILDRTDHLVRVFDKSGKRISEFGRAGEGPGELQYPGLLAAAADTIIVFDDGKFHIFRPDGTSIATRPYLSERSRNYLPIAGAQRTQRGWLVMIRQNNYPRQEEVPRPTRDSLMIKPFDPATGAPGASLVTLLGPETWLLGRAGWIRKPYMAATPGFAIGTDGSIYTTPGDEYRVRVHAPDGTPLRDVAADVRKIPVTEGEFQESLSSEIAVLAKNPGEPGGERAALLDMLRKDGARPGRAEHRPILGRIIAARDGALLLERLDLDPRPNESGDSTRWDYVGTDGRVAGRFVVPPGVFPRLLDGDNVFAVVRDESDIPQVVRYRMIR
jgi:hypothetical protein